MSHPYEKSINAANAVLDKTAYASTYMQFKSHAVEAKTLSAATAAINDWLSPREPKQGWVQFFSGVDFFTGKDRPWKDFDSPPLTAEFTTETGSGLIRHIGGYNWACSLIKPASTEENDKAYIGQDYHVCAAQNVFERCLGDTKSSVPERLLYTRYWQSDTQGALRSIADYFRGFYFMGDE